jgi:hypothetical protein
MNSVFFGEFLVRQGVISQAQLEEGVRYQKEHNTLLGRLAKSRGYMSPNQAGTLLREQCSGMKRFGRLARERGYLSEEQLRKLLQEQAENHIYLGEALNRLGYVGLERLYLELNTFRRQVQAQEAWLRQKLEQLPQQDLVQRGFRLVEDYFYRLGYILKARDILATPGETGEQQVFLADQDFSGIGRALFGLRMPADAVSMTALGNGGCSDRPLEPDRESQIVAEVMHNLNYVVCEDLQRTGYSVKPGPVRTETPVMYKQAVEIELHSLMGDMGLLYYFL